MTRNQKKCELLRQLLDRQITDEEYKRARTWIEASSEQHRRILMEECRIELQPDGPNDANVSTSPKSSGSDTIVRLR